MQDARSNFDTMRPAPLCPNVKQRDPCRDVYISTNCYYGFIEHKNTEKMSNLTDDCEMIEESLVNNVMSSPQHNIRKRSAEISDSPLTKRVREEVQRKQDVEPETNETKKLDLSTEDLLESLFWNIHGGTLFHLIQCL